jgi:hypothetical protein
VGPTCMGDLVIGAHKCVPAHRIDVHVSAGKGIMGMHYGRACWLNRHAHVRACIVNSAPESAPCSEQHMSACVVNRHVHMCVPMGCTGAHVCAPVG